VPDKDTADAHKNEDTNTEPDETTEQDTPDETTEPKKVTKKNQKFYKKPWFWAAAVLSLASIGLAIFFAIFL
jgi:heme-binding NEAT domain protein